MYRITLLLLLVLFLAMGCTSSRIQKMQELNPVEVKSESAYQASAPRIHDLLHTRLEVSFDVQNRRLNGVAELTATPYARQVRFLELDAKGFDIHKVEKLIPEQVPDLPFEYDSLKLTIDLQNLYAPGDTYTIRIIYTAKPDELPRGGSIAITGDKGLYFINPSGTDKSKPFQIWTQGETESSSCWFPTIDKPNERMTHDLLITVADTLVTLSNGLLAGSTHHADGSRTDHWKMDLSHAPYLVMMAIGDFAIVKDHWRDMEVSYYVEKQYAPYAHRIFGHTPEMLDFFSEILQYDYPWQKYAQVVVRDFVSGAMENTTASVFYEYVQMTDRELIDQNHDDIIAHELFHHWFGNLVTCESWANLTLNEGFATLAEYLWAEYKYGKDEAEKQRYDMLLPYLGEAEMDPLSLIRFYYDDKEDLFDVHSYNKGGLVLFMLRDYLGNDIFYKGLHLYLKQNAFKAVEVHHLRLAMEEASGEDLNWFFNQWFLSPGHPVLEVDYFYDSTTSEAVVHIRQMQNSQKVPEVFRLPLQIEIYAGGAKVKHTVWLNKKTDSFRFKTPARPQLIHVNPGRVLLCEIKDNKTIDALAFQFRHVGNYIDKREALDRLNGVEGDTASAIMQVALHDSFYDIRRLAVQYAELTPEVLPVLKEMALHDKKSLVRAAALKRLAETEDEQLIPLFRKAMDDSSFAVVAAALQGLAALDQSAALELAEPLERFASYLIVSAVSELYAVANNSLATDKQYYFEDKLHETYGYARHALIENYGTFLRNKPDSVVIKGIASLKDIALHANPWWERLAAASALFDLLAEKHNEQVQRLLKEAIDEITASEDDQMLKLQYELRGQ
ncbi:MAG: hypothetical protein KatS3mg031_1030 [Chitinophagales bacterium]|nr:MAG: hypothetical protein KatS3mg031_1030 [Chitinophagales bacterium]